MFASYKENMEIDSAKNFQKENNIENNRFFIMKNKKSNKFETDSMLTNYIFFPIITDTDYDREIKIIPFIFYYENNEFKIVKCPYETKFEKDRKYKIDYKRLELLFKNNIESEKINKHFEIQYLDDLLNIDNITDEYYDNFDSKYNFDNSKLYDYIKKSSKHEKNHKIFIYDKLFIEEYIKDKVTNILHASD